MRVLKTWSGPDRRLIEQWMRRSFFDPKVEQQVQRIIREVEARGDEAVADCSARYDEVCLRPEEFLVKDEELARARRKIERDFVSVIREIERNLTFYHRRQKPEDWKMEGGNGGTVGERWVPVNRVGLYVPAGKAPLVSTVLMGVVPAKVAGVKQIVVCSPPSRNGEIDVHILATCAFLGVREVYRIGGAQAIGAMAIGTKTVPRVDKIVGPGGIYVTMAKKVLYGRVGIDIVAGPSEVLIVADDSAEPSYVAIDLLSQAEHGTGREVCVLVTHSRPLVEKVRKELVKRVSAGKRKGFPRRLLSSIIVVVTKSLAESLEFANQFAAEHVEVVTRRAASVANRIVNAGAIFVGKYSPVPLGDFYAGPNHVLPTGGAARFSSGLSVTDFMKRMGVIAYTKKSLRTALPAMEKMGEVERLEGHAEAVRTRFSEISK